MKNYLIYKSNNLLNKKKILLEKDYILEENKLSNDFSPAILCYSDTLSLSSLGDRSLLIKVMLNSSFVIQDTDCEKLEDFLTGVGNLEFNQFYCNALNSKSKTPIIEYAKKKKDWNWYSKNEDLLEDVMDNIKTTYSYLLPLIYKYYMKKEINILKINNTYLILHPTLVINNLQSL